MVVRGYIRGSKQSICGCEELVAAAGNLGTAATSALAEVPGQPGESSRKPRRSGQGQR